MPGGVPFVGEAAVLLDVAGAGGGGGLAELVEQQPVEDEQVGGVAVPGLPGDQLPADLHAEVVGEQDGVEWQPLLRPAGGGLPDGGELGLGRGQSRADGLGEGADPALGDLGEFAGDLFARQPAVGRYAFQQGGDDGLDQLRHGAEQPLVGGHSTDHRDPPTGCASG